MVLGTPSLPAGYTIAEPLDKTIAVGGSDTFTVQLSTAKAGMFAGDISFATNDLSANPFNFKVKGKVTPLPPEISVFDGPTNITSGQTTSIDLGSAARGMVAPSETFTIRNDGDQTLVLNAKSFTDTTHFTVGRPGDTTLAAGQTTTFTVTWNTDAVWSGSEQISFLGNNADHDAPCSFSFPVSGTVRALLHDASTLGLYNPTTSTFYLRNSISLQGPTDKHYADAMFSYSAAQAGWLPLPATGTATARTPRPL